MKGRIARICTSFIDVPDKISVAVYFAGCSIRCKGCQNAHLWDPNSGEEKKLEEVVKKIENHPLAEYVVFLGGEPTDQIEFLINICQNIKTKRMALYTGREFEQLPQQLLQYLDLIICGPYRQDLHVGGWPASSNQRIFKKEQKQWIQINTQSTTRTPKHLEKSMNQLP